MSRKNIVVTPSAEVSRIERFQALLPGRYWRSLKDFKNEHITKGSVLLLQSLRYVDDKPHTVILRAHPSHYGMSVQVAIDQNNPDRGYRIGKLTEHRFLLKDFLENFEFEPDATQVRATEVKAVQGKIALLQNELLEAQANPGKMTEIVSGLLQKQTQENASSSDEVPGASIGKDTEEQDASTALMSPSGSVVAAITEQSLCGTLKGEVTEELVDSLKTAASREHQIATVKANWIKAKTAEISDTLLTLTPFFEEQAAAALAQTEDVRSYADKIIQGIESLDLYIGKGVEVETICKGLSAPATEPLTLMQRKLLMDEELALWADVNEAFDFEKESVFFQALRKHPEFIAQVFPTERCVVMLAVTQRVIEYKDPWVAAAKNAENRKVFLLIRDGQNIHRVFSPVESHLGAARLFPSKDEQDRIFTGIDGEMVKFEDVAYTDKLALHEVHALHYKRLLILLAGLDHRLKLFGNFYPEAASLSFVSMDFQKEHLRFIFDDAAQTLGEDLLPVGEWIRQKNAYLRPSSRVLCAWNVLMTPETAPAAYKVSHYGHRASEAYKVYSPEADFDVLTVHKSGSDLTVSIPISGFALSTSARRTFNCRVNLSRFEAQDMGSLGYLCLDAVSPEELRRYLNSRKDRQNHVFYIRFFKRALQFVEAERAEERPAREALLEALRRGNIASGAYALELVDQAVMAWRAKNSGASLPKVSEQQSKDWKALLDQMYALARQDGGLIEKVQAIAEKEKLAPLRLVLTGQAKHVLYAAAAPSAQDNRLQAHAWVWRMPLASGKTGLNVKSRKWVRLERACAAETTVHEWPEESSWVERPSAFISLEQKADRLQYAQQFENALKEISCTMTEETFKRYFENWHQVRYAANRTSRIVINPKLAVPFGLILNKEGTSARYIGIAVDRPHALLYKLAPNDAYRAAIKKEFISLYRNKTSATESFESNLEIQELHSLIKVGMSLQKEATGGFFVESKTLGYSHLSIEETPDPRLAPRLTQWLSNLQRYDENKKIWLCPSVEHTKGSIIDELLGIKLPEGYAPVKIYEIVRRDEPEDTEAQYARWFDIMDFEDTREGPIHGNGAFSISIHMTMAVDRESALEQIKRQLTEEGIAHEHLVAAQHCAAAPETPRDVERWYVVEKTETQT